MKQPMKSRPPVIVKGRGNIVEVFNELERVLSNADELDTTHFP
jgi:hypothetical protein